MNKKNAYNNMFYHFKSIQIPQQSIGHRTLSLIIILSQLFLIKIYTILILNFFKKLTLSNIIIYCKMKVGL